MSMLIVSWVRCNRPFCLAEHQGNRPTATAAGWVCDTPRGVDHCPDHKADAPRSRPRGTCSFCGGEYALSADGLPTAHTTEFLQRCPGSYIAARPLSGGA